MAKADTRKSKPSRTNPGSLTLKSLMVFAFKLFTKLIIVPALFSSMVWGMLISSDNTKVSKWVYFIILLGMLIVLIFQRKNPVNFPEKLSSKWDRYLIGAEVLGFFISLTILAMVVFSFLSYQLYLANNAHYTFTGEKLASGNLINFYFYETLDMIPILDIPQTLQLSKAITANYGLASWLLLFYKAFFIFLVIAGFRDWYKKKFAEKEKTAKNISDSKSIKSEG